MFELDAMDANDRPLPGNLSIAGARTFDALPYAWVFLFIALVTLVMRTLQPFVSPVLDVTNVALLYLLPVMFVAVRWGRGPSIFAALLAVLGFDVFFVPPHLSVTVADFRYVFVFIVFLLDAIITGTLASRLRSQAQSALRREERTSVLYTLSRRMAAETNLPALLQTVVSAVAAVIDGKAVLFMPDDSGAVVTMAAAPGAIDEVGEEMRDVALWVYEHGRSAGKGTSSFTASGGLFIPLSAEENRIGVLGVLTPSTAVLPPEQRQLLDALASLASMAIARHQLGAEAQKAKHAEESERLRTALFNSVSHDLRTPLASITGAVTSLQEAGDIYSPEDRLTLIETIQEGALRLSHLVSNLLDTARLESGMLQLNKDWCDIQDIIGVSIRRSRESLAGRHLAVEVPPEVPLVQADCSLIEQVITNLFYNAVKYSPAASEIRVAVSVGGHELTVTVGDAGPGIPEKDRERVFDKFYRLHSPEHVLGTGLGLSICKGFVEAHGGRMWVEPGPVKGSVFAFALPLDEQPTTEEPVRAAGGNNGR